MLCDTEAEERVTKKMNEYPHSYLSYKILTENTLLASSFIVQAVILHNLNGVMYVAAFVISATCLLPSALSMHTQDKGFFKCFVRTRVSKFNHFNLNQSMMK